MRRALAAVSLFAAFIASACIIGPKQDDPADERALVDGGVIFPDAGLGGGADATASGDTSPAPHDNEAGADAASDTAADAIDGDAPDADANDAVSDASDAAEGG